MPSVLFLQGNYNNKLCNNSNMQYTLECTCKWEAVHACARVWVTVFFFLSLLLLLCVITYFWCLFIYAPTAQMVATWFLCHP